MNGITREKVIQICRNLSVPIYQRNFSLVDTYSAEGAFLTDTFGGLIQVFSIDGHQIGNGLEGEIAVKLRKFYEAMIEQN